MEIDMETRNEELRSRSSSAVASRSPEDTATAEPVTAVTPRDTRHADAGATVAADHRRGVEGATGDGVRYAHEGSFAAGQESYPHQPELLAHRGTFAEGSEAGKLPCEGGFADGQRAFARHPETVAYRGDFAAGQRRNVRGSA
jgi:hypothetical protein